MAHVTLVANVGNGTTSYQTLSSRTETQGTISTSFVTYKLTASFGGGWTFSRWECRYREDIWFSTEYSHSFGPWNAWTTISTDNPATVELQHESNDSYETIFGTVHSVREYEVRAVFVQATYSVSVQVSSDSPANSGSVTGGGNGYGYNSSCTVWAFPNSGFIFKKWTTTDSAQAVAVSTDSTYTFAVTGDLTLYAHFVRAATGKLLYGSSNTLLHGASGTLLYDDERNPS